MSGLLGENLGQDGLQAMAGHSGGHGEYSGGIGDPGESQVLGYFNEDSLQKHIKSWMKGPKENNSFKGIKSLETAADEGLLRPGQLIFGTVSIKHHEDADGFQGWIYDSFSSLIALMTTNQMRLFAYLHVAIYAGKVGGVHYTIENGGHDGTGIGAIAARPIDGAFEPEADFFLVSPPKDKHGRSTRYIVIQRALASIGVTYEYHMRAISCETFCTAILHPFDDSFRPIQRSIVRSHKKNLPQDDEARQLKEDTEKYKRFHSKLCQQISRVPEGILLSLEFHLKKRQNKPGEPWFEEMIQSYQEFEQAFSSDPVSACRYLDQGLIVEAEILNKMLIEAARKGDRMLVNNLISYGADIGKMLVEAARKGDRMLVNNLISYGADIDKMLVEAARQGDSLLVKKLISYGANMETLNKMLIEAASKGDSVLVNNLISYGADIDKILEDAASKGDSILVTNIFLSDPVSACQYLDQGLIVEAEILNKILVEAARKGYSVLVSKLISYWTDKGLIVEAEILNEILLEAARQGDSILVNNLISNGANIDHKDKHGKHRRTALMLASQHGHIDTLTILIHNKANINSQTSLGFTALILAALWGHSHIVALLLQHRANIDYQTSQGYTALILAASSGHSHIVELLIQHGADIHCQTLSDDTALMLAALSGHSHIVELLIQHGADIHCQNTHGETALMEAAESVHAHTVELLIQHGADIHCQNTHGETALSIAQECHHTHIVDIINNHAVKKE